MRNISGPLNPMFGKKHTEEAKKKMSEKKMGNNYRLGTKMSDETKEKLRKINLGRKISEETIIKLKRKIPWNKGKKGYSIHTIESIKKMREKIKGRKKSEEHKKNLSKAKTNQWKDENFAKKMIMCWGFKPNKKELILDRILQDNFPEQWRYVGDGQIIIGGLCPDFINVDGKKLIVELFGDYWHNRKNIRYNSTEEGRKKAFREFGFDTLILWENELKNIDRIIEKIYIFMRGR